MKEKNDLRREFRDSQLTINLMSEALILHQTYPKMPTKEFLAKMVYITQSAKIMKKVDKMTQELDNSVKDIQQMQHLNLSLKIADRGKSPLLPLSTVLVPPNPSIHKTSISSVFEKTHFQPYYKFIQKVSITDSVPATETVQEEVEEERKDQPISVRSSKLHLESEQKDNDNESVALSLSRIFDFMPSISSSKENTEEDYYFDSVYSENEIH